MKTNMSVFANNVFCRRIIFTSSMHITIIITNNFHRIIRLCRPILTLLCLLLLVFFYFISFSFMLLHSIFTIIKQRHSARYYVTLFQIARCHRCFLLSTSHILAPAHTYTPTQTKKVFSWLTGNKRRSGDNDSPHATNDGRLTYTADSMNIIDATNPNAIHLIDMDPVADLNLWQLADTGTGWLSQ